MGASFPMLPAGLVYPESVGDVGISGVGDTITCATTKDLSSSGMVSFSRLQNLRRKLRLNSRPVLEDGMEQSLTRGSEASEAKQKSGGTCSCCWQVAATVCPARSERAVIDEGDLTVQHLMCEVGERPPSDGATSMFRALNVEFTVCQFSATLAMSFVFVGDNNILFSCALLATSGSFKASLEQSILGSTRSDTRATFPTTSSPKSMRLCPPPSILGRYNRSRAKIGRSACRSAA
mmetsp:Transcript_41560/g.88567  ORF Transcript_41560/g.88567 Transcript_41560/m.88567 type:complete len:235 (-) Transcript_41560:34-738(-)